MLLSTHQFKSATGWDKALQPALDSENTLVIAFGTADAQALRGALADLHAAFPRSVLMGCSSAGEIYDRSLDDGTLVVAAMQCEHSGVRLASQAITQASSSFEVGAQLANRLRAPDLKAVFVLSDGLCVNGSELAKGLSQHLPPGVVVTGGLAGDASRFQKTWTLVGATPRPGHVVAAGLYGERLGVSHGSRGGWDVLGTQREVTQAKGNVLYSLDGQPALALYKKYLGERAAGLPATGLLFPLAIHGEQDTDELTVRTILGINEDDNSIIFAGDIPQGSQVSLMRANFERLIDGAADAAHDLALGGHAGAPVLTLAISCFGRRMVLAQRSEEEIEAVLDGLPPQARLIGFYSYGELSPLASGRCDLHNQTMTLTSFWEH